MAARLAQWQARAQLDRARRTKGSAWSFSARAEVAGGGAPVVAPRTYQDGQAARCGSNAAGGDDDGSAACPGSPVRECQLAPDDLYAAWRRAAAAGGRGSKALLAAAADAAAFGNAEEESQKNVDAPPDAVVRLSYEEDEYCNDGDSYSVACYETIVIREAWCVLRAER